MAANDFNGDGRSDILFRESDGAIFNILGQPDGAFKNNGDNSWMHGGADWGVAGIGDFNGDGRSDILWRNSDGLIFNGSSSSTGGPQDNYDNGWLMVDNAWQIAGVGDFNGDGRADILVRDASGTIKNYLGQSTGGFVENSANLFTTVSPDWRVAGIGDFNGDGRDDIMWRHTSGAIFDFLGSEKGGVVNNGDNSWTAVETSWRFVGSGDFDGDGRSDVLWRNDGGAMWDFLGTASGGVRNNGDNSWTMTPASLQIVSLADFNGDGRDDILWRDAAGTITDSLGTAAGSFSPNPATRVEVDPHWLVQDPHVVSYLSGVGFWDY